MNVTGSEFDLPPTATVRTVVVCSTPRSGSTMLCTALAGTGRAGVPGEYFHPTHVATYARRFHTPTMDAYEAALFGHRTTPNGTFSVKLHFPHLEPCLRGRPMAEVFPQPRLVRITRRDRVAQAVSLARARRTGQWARAEDTTLAGVGAGDYAFPEVFNAHGTILLQEAGWTAWLADQRIDAIPVVYEDLVERYEETLSALLAALDLSTGGGPLPMPRTAPQRDEASATWARRYRADLATYGLHAD